MAASDKPVTKSKAERISDYDLDNNKGQEAGIATERSEAASLIRNREEEDDFRFSKL